MYQESPCSDVLRNRATKPLLRQKQGQKHLTWLKEKNNWIVLQWSKILFSDKRTFCISFGNQGLEEDWSGTESKLFEARCEVSKSKMIWGAVTSAGVGPMCFIKSKVNAAIYQEILITLCFHLLTIFMERLISFFRRILEPAHSAKTTFKWFADHDITVLDRSAYMPDLNPI